MRLASKRVFFGGFVFDVWDGVYLPADDSFLFAENLVVCEGDFVVDVGCGCGLLGVVAAEKASGVVGVDVNPFAVGCARENARLNGVGDKMFFVRGDLFSAFGVGVRFDLVLFNAPYLPVELGEGVSWVERAWAGGKSGRRVIDRFVGDVSRYLKRGGRVLLMQSSLAGVEKTLKGFRKEGLRASVVVERGLPFFEMLVLVEAKRV